MSSMIVTIKGLVKHPIVLDPGVWIFDDRKVNLSTYFKTDRNQDEDESVKQLSRAWDAQRTGAALPNTNSNKIEVNKKDLTENSLGIPLAPFLKNASPEAGAEMVRFSRSGDLEEFICPLKVAEKGILAFSSNGKPLKENGPVHFYFGDGSNENNPVTDIVSIIVS